MKRNLAVLVGILVFSFFAAATVKHLWTQRQDRIAVEREKQEEYEEKQKAAQLAKKKISERAEDLVDEWFVVTNNLSHSYESDNVIDPWGVPIKIEKQDNGFFIASAGPDGSWDTDDDIARSPEKKGILQNAKDKLKGLKFW